MIGFVCGRSRKAGASQWNARFVLAAYTLLCILALRRTAALAPPPSYFDSLNFDGQASRIALQPPRQQTSSLTESDYKRLVQVQQKRALFLARQANAQVNASESSATNAKDKGQTIGYLEYSYYAPLNVSQDPTQSIFVQLDTGSSDLWFVASACQAAQCNTDQVLKFDETKSSTFRALVIGQDVNLTTSTQSVPQANVTVSALGAQTVSMISSAASTVMVSKRRVAQPMIFAAGTAADSASKDVPFGVVYDDETSASGSLATDNVMMANLPSTRQVFGLVNDTNITLARQGISGVLGMGFPRGSVIARSLIGTTTNVSTAPLLTRLLSNSQNSYPLFTLSLNTTGGTLTLGAADSRILSTDEQRGQVEWHNVIPFPSGNTNMPLNATNNRDAEALDSYLYWALHLTGLGYNGTSIAVMPTYSQVGRQPIALIDSGTPGIVGPAAQVDALFNTIYGARHVGNGQYVVPCTTQGRLLFSFGGRNYTLLPDDYIIGPASGNPYLCLAWPIAGLPGNDGVDWVLGQAFMRAQYTLFSLGIVGREAPKVGLYPLRAAPTDLAAIVAVEAEASVSAFVAQATPVLTTLPNSLVTISSPTSIASYAFMNATSTPSAGLLPSHISPYAIAPSNYSPILSGATGDTQLPVLASPASNLPVPSNPAEVARDAAHPGPSTVVRLSTSSLLVLLCGTTLLFAVFTS